MNESEFKELLAKYRLGACTAAELVLLESWYLSEAGTARNAIDEESLLTAQTKIAAAIEKNTGLKLVGRIPVLRPWRRIAAAAAVLIFLSIGTYLLLHQQRPQQTAKYRIHDIVPGGNKAILTLAGGRTIDLTGAKNGKLAQQGNVAVRKNREGQVVYEGSKSETGNPAYGIVYNTMTTPRGGQYHLTLADGTDVWLNAASSIRYPTAFSGGKRQVEITGEAYFEVVHSKSKPFRVLSNGQVVEVLGTHFNINAYSDEPVVKTTLLEGSIRISKGGQAALLKPGEQAQINAGSGKISVVYADTEDAVAWKEGMFRFSDQRLESIMRQLSRWYDVDVRYDDERLKTLTFNGIITHFSSASKVLRMLELTRQVHFRIEGKTIIVTK